MRCERYRLEFRIRSIVLPNRMQVATSDVRCLVHDLSLLVVPAGGIATDLLIVHRSTVVGRRTAGFYHGTTDSTGNSSVDYETSGEQYGQNRSFRFRYVRRLTEKKRYPKEKNKIG